MSAPQVAGTAAAIAVVLGLAAWLYDRAAMPAHPMAGDDFHRIVRQLASDARESERLARLAGAAQVNEHYARTQHDKIAEDVRDAHRSLLVPPPQGRENDVRIALDLAGRMTDLLDGSAPQLADRAAMQKLQAEHGRIAVQLEGIASR